MKRAKIYIEGADNGFIVKVKNHGETSFKEPYQKTLVVATCFKDLLEILEDIYFPEDHKDEK